MKNEYSAILTKIFYALICILVVLIMNLLVSTIALNGGTATSKPNTTETDAITEDASYDVSSFKTLNLSEVLDLFDTKGTHVLYLGRSTCSACVGFLPTLKSVQADLDYVTQYLDITTVDTSSDDFKTFSDKLSKKIDVSTNGKTENGPIIDYYGYTPMVILIKNGKVADAFVGAYSEDMFKEFLSNNDVK